MKNLIIGIIALSFVLISCTKEKKSLPTKIYFDDLGNRIELTKNPERIISAAPNLTEIIFALGAGDLLVGRTNFCNYPEETNKIPVVGDMFHLNLEKIVDLNPDLIFLTVEGNTKELYDKLKNLGLNVYVTNPKNLSGIKKSIRDIGEILNREKEADSIISDIEKRLNKINSERFQRQTAMFVVSFSPLIIAGKNTFIDEILSSVNLENIAPEKSFSAYPMISREEVINKNPDVILLPSINFSIEKILEVYPEWKEINAIKKGKIIYVDQDLFFRPGPRFIDAIEFLQKELSKH
ncbi:MAG: cobalamin-binding protein [Ignavibacteria bacterium]|jgi:iron complex transport system substrate-binding protein|nr:cobalamin-binding protein [Ignavibacteria bacterium]MDH7528327.1 cobalamin-binding protein [Ignavibacteria bacterium]NPV12513.1 cobalamin-binding protein [Ignavibacteria bacterium]